MKNLSIPPPIVETIDDSNASSDNCQEPQDSVEALPVMETVEEADEFQEEEEEDLNSNVEDINLEINVEKEDLDSNAGPLEEKITSDLVDQQRSDNAPNPTEGGKKSFLIGDSDAEVNGVNKEIEFNRDKCEDDSFVEDVMLTNENDDNVLDVNNDDVVMEVKGEEDVTISIASEKIVENGDSHLEIGAEDGSIVSNLISDVKFENYGKICFVSEPESDLEGKT